MKTGNENGAKCQKRARKIILKIDIICKNIHFKIIVTILSLVCFRNLLESIILERTLSQSSWYNIHTILI